MKIVVQVAEADDAKAWDLLQRHSPGVALPNRTFVLSKEALDALLKAGIRVVVLSDEPHALTEEGVLSGERI